MMRSCLHAVSLACDCNVTLGGSVNKTETAKVPESILVLLVSRPKDVVVDIDAAEADNELAAVEYVHRFLSLTMVPRRELQLLGLGAMLIACKYEEIRAPEIYDFVCISDNAYSRKQISVPHNELDKIARGDLDKMTLIEDGVVGNMTKAEQLAANTRIDAATSPTWIPLDDLKVVFCSITEDLVQMITDTYRRIDNFARNNQQPPSSEAASRPNDAVVDIDAADANNELAAAEYEDGIFRSQKKRKKTNNKVLDMASSRVSDLLHQRGIAGEIKSKNVAGHGRQNRKVLITGREVDHQILISSLKKLSMICNLCRKHKDLYMRMVKSPGGPSVKFLVNVVHTMEELKLTGNFLKRC
ncbi:Cyclin-like superfamily [Arabidopsis thaliana x Arabidopsis arenosa]|uniref:Cyclin-like superfamily n=1 Tax=Arabidopsis thaliana x Arabidopsis arenosa TaxID=1240361 RepID=A0A8T2A8R0_9BRAS|nr:Cyclin-like superfamily [Arabidopsis thaliana x Arabidopsis arenosa]